MVVTKSKTNKMQKKNFLTLLLVFTIGILSAQYHHNFGLNYHYVGGTAISGNYNMRLNLFGKNNWRFAFEANPHLGAALNSYNSDGFYPFFQVNGGLATHIGMGSSFDVLRYTGYAIRGGGSLYNLAPFSEENAIQYGVLVGGDYKFQTENLRTFSFQINAVYPLNPETPNNFIIQAGINYHFGLY
jgi:hypothetical protein